VLRVAGGEKRGRKTATPNTATRWPSVSGLAAAVDEYEHAEHGGHTVRRVTGVCHGFLEAGSGSEMEVSLRGPTGTLLA
jgi:hypothetical protein